MRSYKRLNLAVWRKSTLLGQGVKGVILGEFCARKRPNLFAGAFRQNLDLTGGTNFYRPVDVSNGSAVQYGAIIATANVITATRFASISWPRGVCFAEELICTKYDDASRLVMTNGTLDDRNVESWGCEREMMVCLCVRQRLNGSQSRPQLAITRRFISPIYPPVSTFGESEIEHTRHTDFCPQVLLIPHGDVALGTSCETIMLKVVHMS